MKEDAVYLKHIQDSIKQILEYTHEGKNDFLIDRKTQDAVVRNLEIIGEAVKNISPDLKLRYPQLPWQSMAGMRDKLIHEYFGVDLDLVWSVVENYLSTLDETITGILSA